MTQALTFNTSNDNATLFTSVPTISSSGDLSYTLSGSSGTAIVSVTLSDDASDDGGALTTAAQTFAITVAPNSPPMVAVDGSAGLVRTTLVEFTGTSGANLGSNPAGSLVQGIDGSFYGMTKQGGTSNLGTAFKMTSDGVRTTLVNFTGTGGTSPGSYPQGSLVQGSDGSFYGMTQQGGTGNIGTIFKMTSAGIHTTLVNFTGVGGDYPGSYPYLGHLVQGSDGNLYGMTATGGTGGMGTVFKMTPEGVLTTLVNFTGTSGASPGKIPFGSLMQCSDGSFYGMTYQGGTGNLGTAFKMTSAGVRTTLVNFTGTSGTNLGSYPQGGLVQGSDGSFYGMTRVGGTGNLGTVFKMTNDGVCTTLVSFTGTSGANSGAQPFGTLVQGSDGSFYGMTQYGGTGNLGTVFKLGSPLVLATGAEGSAVTKTGTFSDADGNATATLTASTGTVMQNNAEGTWTWTNTGADGPATSTVTITATDTASATATGTFTFSVANVGPSFDLGANDILPSGVLSRNVSFADPGSDTWTGVVNYGDGENQSLTIDQGAKTFSLNHSYTLSGTYNVTVNLNDDDGGSFTDSYTVTVNLSPEIVIEDTSLTPAITLADGTSVVSIGTPLVMESASKTLTIRNIGTAPLAGLGYTLDGPASNDYSLTGLPSSIAPGASVQVTLQFTPSAVGLRTATLRILSNDGDESSFDIALEGIGLNNAPSIAPLADQTVDEDIGVILGLAISDVESAPAVLITNATSSNQAVVPNGNLAFSGNGANKTLMVTPLANQSGTTIITVTVSDGGLSSSRSFVLNVNPVNDAPTIGAIAPQTMQEDDLLFTPTIPVADVDSPWSMLTVSYESSNPLLIRASDIGSNEGGGGLFFGIQPLPDQFGTTMITITVSDGLATASSSFLLTVNPVNDPPRIVSIAGVNMANPNTNPPHILVDVNTTSEWIPFEMEDVDNTDALASLLFIEDGPFSGDPNLVAASGLEVDNVGKRFRMTPTPNHSGDALLTLRASDGTSYMDRRVWLRVFAPEISVEPLLGDTIVAGSTLFVSDFVGIARDTSGTAGFRVRNLGSWMSDPNDPLKFYGLLKDIRVEITGSDAGMFSVVAPLDPNSIVGGSSRIFEIRFTPTSGGERFATIHVFSNDTDEPDYAFQVRGTSPMTSIESWRQTTLGTTSNTGDAADGADRNGNGIPNLIEYALNGDPLGATTGTSILPTYSLSATNRLQFMFTQNPIRPDITLKVQVSNGLGSEWTDLAQSTNDGPFIAITSGTTVTEIGTGSARSIIVTDPITIDAAPAAGRFMRLVVTSP